MLKAFSFILFLAAIGGGAYWYFFMRSGDGDAKRPKARISGLQSDVQIMAGEGGMGYVSGVSRNDLFAGQGYHHALVAGEQLVQLRSLFKGMPVEGMPRDIQTAAELFYYLDLESVARDSVGLYPPAVLEVIQSYVNGLSAGMLRGVKAWTVEDVLLLQRGYAFLLGHNVAKEWLRQHLYREIGPERFEQISNYQGVKALHFGSKHIFRPELMRLLAAPLAETVLIGGEKGLIAQQTRAHPYWRFLFQPMELELQGRYKVAGLSLAGLPFLLSGAGQDFLFANQPYLANDEQFYFLPAGSFVGREELVTVHQNAGSQNRYPEPPKTTPYGRDITGLILVDGEYSAYYYWHGLRPSADLATWFYLLEAGSVEEMTTAYQYHQVPAVRAFLRRNDRPPVYINVLPGQPDDEVTVLGGQPGALLFRGPFIQGAVDADNVHGFGFSDRLEDPESALETQIVTSPLDRELIRVVKYYLNASFRSSLTGSQRERLTTLLDGPPSAQRAFLVQTIWRRLQSTVYKDLIDKFSQNDLSIPDLELKRLLLLELDISRDRDAASPRDRLADGHQVTGALGEALTLYARTARGESPFVYPFSGAGGEVISIYLANGLHTRDAAMGTAFADMSLNINRAAVQTIVWGRTFHFWFYPVNPNQTVPKKIEPSDDSGKLTVTNLKAGN